MKAAFILGLALAGSALAMGTQQCTSADKAADAKTVVKYATMNMRYDNPDDSLNDWTHRRPRVASFIREQGWDVFGTQEMLAHQVDQLLEDLPQYGQVGIGREGGRNGEYSAIFYNKERFDTIATGTFSLSEHPEVIGEMGWDAACPRIASWAELRDKANGKIFMAVNTHFDHVGTTARRQSALLIIDKIKEIVGDKPAILTGDFNVDDQSDAYRTITTNEFVLRDARKQAPKVSGEPGSWHDFGELPRKYYQIIDFIFVTPTIQVDSVAVPYSQTARGEYLTDHNPVIATLEF